MTDNLSIDLERSIFTIVNAIYTDVESCQQFLPKHEQDIAGGLLDFIYDSGELYAPEFRKQFNKLEAAVGFDKAKSLIEVFVRKNY